MNRLVLAAIVEGQPWWNYPGLELWKFVNLFVFIGLALYLHRRFGRPISEGLRLRGERIRRELEAAREKKQEAEAKLLEVENRLKRLDSEIAAIREHAKAEAEAERERIKLTAEAEVAKLREHAQKEIQTAGKAAIQELRIFAAEQSVNLAENALRQEIRDEDETRLIGMSVERLGRGAQ